MADRDDIVRVTHPGDPRRCQAITLHGQCDKVAMDNFHLCPLHGRRATAEKAGLKNYRIEKYHGRLAELSYSDNIKSLTDEIALVRMTLEALVNKTKDSFELSLQADHMIKLVSTIERLVTSCQKLDIQNNQMLTIDQLNTLIEALIKLLSKYVTGDDLKLCIAEIAALVANDQSIYDKVVTELDR